MGGCASRYLFLISTPQKGTFSEIFATQRAALRPTVWASYGILLEMENKAPVKPTESKSPTEQEPQVILKHIKFEKL